MAREKAVLVFPTEWVVEVQNIIQDEKKSVANAGKIPRVATPLLNAKPEAYRPHFVSLGPYHHGTLEKRIAASSSAVDSYEFRELKMSTVEAYKIQYAATLWRNSNKSLYDIAEKIKAENIKQIEDFYDWPINSDGEYPLHFALMMAIDSSFLLRFLFSLSGPSDDHGMKRLEFSTKCDIMKLENQIPLFLLRNLFDIAKDAGGHGDISKLMQKTCRELSPFHPIDKADNEYSTAEKANNDSETKFNDEPHLLGCVHAFVSPFLKVNTDDNSSERTVFQKMKHSLEELVAVVVAAVFTIFRVRHPSEEGRHDILNSYNAGELKKGGIKFKPFSRPPYEIRLDKYSGTLYLPPITVSEMQSEVWFRNMVAFEFNDAARGDSVTRYVGLVDCLIDTPDDVRLLRESQVILRESLMLTDDKIAGMWNGMCHPILTGHLEPPRELSAALKDVLIRKYYMSIVKKVLWEFYWDHLSKPGKGVALLVGILLLLMTCAQTFFSWRDWFHNDRSQTPKTLRH